MPETAAAKATKGTKPPNNSNSRDNHHQRSKRRNKNAPIPRTSRRGPPGILLTCEAGREVKCEREGLDILRHYYKNDSQQKDGTGTTISTDDGDKKSESKAPPKKLSLEDELKLLKKGGGTASSTDDNLSSNGKTPFVVYETKCRGTVFVMNTTPGASIAIDDEDDDNDDGDNAEETTRAIKKRKTDDNEPPKTTKTEDTTTTDTATPNEDGDIEKQQQQQPWDPVMTIKAICDDILGDKRTAPSSRFVTRMVPVQVTCYPATKEIVKVAKALIEHYLFPRLAATTTSTGTGDDGPAADASTETTAVEKTTFAISFHRRNCSHLSRDEVIEGVGTLLEEARFKVDLKEPEYTILIEVCKTLCCMSIVKDMNAYRKFNLMTLREVLDQKQHNDK